MKDYVYLMLMKSSPAVYKIGVSRSPESRCRQFSCGPWRVEIVHKIESIDSRGVERWLHRRFKDKHIRYEWFNLNDDDVALIKSVDICDHPGGLPDNLMPQDGEFFTTRRFVRNPEAKFLFRVDELADLHPMMRPLTDDKEIMRSLGNRLAYLRMKKGFDLHDIHILRFKYDVEHPGKATRRFRPDSYSSRQRLERGIGAITGEAILTYAYNLEMTVADVLGESMLHLWPEICADDLHIERRINIERKISPRETHVRRRDRISPAC